jgi:hypothetical protein
MQAVPGSVGAVVRATRSTKSDFDRAARAAAQRREARGCGSAALLRAREGHSLAEPGGARAREAMGARRSAKEWR